MIERNAYLAVLWAGLGLGLALSAALGAEPPPQPPAEQKVDFARDVRTVLAGRCFTCHGPDESARKADLRLDLREVAVRPGKDGKAAIVAGDPRNSELVRRIFSNDPDELMPPPEVKKPLTAEEKEILKRWVEQGAEYELQWSLNPLKRHAPPAIKDRTWVENKIDSFVLAKLEENGLKPSPRADKHTLVRRLYLDLLGLPPTPRQAEEFANDTRSDAWERLVDRVLNDPRFGEKIGLIWLDLARFGDTNGYHYDSTREMWLWRDYVINAYNHDMPFDRFTIEQLAGDLLDKPTTQQLIASGFNRNTRFNEEGGADPEEFAVTYAKDRVFTLGQVWLGLTTGCAECHSHKYDPISHKEYYQLFAFFNSIKEPMASGNHGQKLEPLLRVPTPDQERALAKAKAKLRQLEEKIGEELAKVTYDEPADPQGDAPPGPVDFAWIDDNVPAGAQLQGNGQEPAWNWVGAPDHPVFKGQRSMRRSGSGLTQQVFTGAKEPLTIHEGDRLFAYIWLDPSDPTRMVQLQFHTADGSWEHRAFWGVDKGYGPTKFHAGKLPAMGQWVRLEVDAAKVGLTPGDKVDGWAFTQFGGTIYYDYAGVNTDSPPSDKHLKSLKAWEKIASAPKEIAEVIKIDPAERTPGQQKLVRDYYLRHVYAGTRAVFDGLNAQFAAQQQKVAQIESSIPTTMISEELDTPRPAHLLIRGDFLTPGEPVDREVPAVFPPMDKDLPRNRLGLAKWLVDPDHPLTSRVAVNRLWYQMFGTGIVKTLGDFGFQGELPSHPELLDWLATEYIRTGWSTKAILRQIALSATYQQSSSIKGNIAQQDPYNRLLYRAPRFRLTAEEVRDGALRIADLLSTKIGGPSVMPYQPEDFYKGKNENWPWKLADGDDLYRRGMYTFWRRTSLHPMFAIFDAPSREVCTVERPRTNTPLQALTTLNSPMFVEAARVLAQNLMKETPADDLRRIDELFQRIMVRKPTAAETELIGQIYRQQLELFRADPSAAGQLVQTGQYRKVEGLSPAEHAAWTAVANALMNTDEAITRE